MRSLKILLILFLVTDVRPDPSGYQRWLKEHPGDVSDSELALYNNLIAFSQDRKAGHRPEKLAPASTEPYPSGILGNWELGLSMESLHGFSKPLAVQNQAGVLSANNLKFAPKGYRVEASKRLGMGDRHTFHTKILYRNHSDSFNDDTNNYSLSTGELIRQVQGNFDLDMTEFDLYWVQRQAQNYRHSTGWIGGVRISHAKAESKMTGAGAGFNTITDWSFKHTGIGPYLGYQGSMPLGKDATLALKVRQGVLFSRGETRQSHQSGQPPTTVQSRSFNKNPSFPFTEIDFGIQFFATRHLHIHTGYSWHKANLYTIPFANQTEINDLNFQGPKATLSLLF
jgi:hypothetical protein